MQTGKLPPDLTNLYLLLCLRTYYHFKYVSYLDQNSLLFHNQHGFRSRGGCETQLIQFTQDLYDTLNQGGQTDVIIMDFSKAFDKVDHQRLLLKLQHDCYCGLSPSYRVDHRVWSCLVPAQFCLGCHRDPCLGPVGFSCTLTTCQTQ